MTDYRKPRSAAVSLARSSRAKDVYPIGYVLYLHHAKELMSILDSQDEYLDNDRSSS
jgi:hypothetical protein